MRQSRCAGHVLVIFVRSVCVAREITRISHTSCFKCLDFLVALLKDESGWHYFMNQNCGIVLIGCGYFYIFPIAPVIWSCCIHCNVLHSLDSPSDYSASRSLSARHTPEASAMLSSDSPKSVPGSRSTKFSPAATYAGLGHPLSDNEPLRSVGLSSHHSRLPSAPSVVIGVCVRMCVRACVCLSVALSKCVMCCIAPMP